MKITIVREQNHPSYLRNKLIAAGIVQGVAVGDYTYGEPKLVLRKGTRLVIGKFCSIADTSTIGFDVQHDIDCISTYPFRIEGKPLGEQWHNKNQKKNIITIGNDVWIGSGARVMGGVTIGDGAVIGANAMVTKDVAPYAVVVGNPIQEVRKRFSDDNINKLLKIKWWDWPIEKIQQHAELLRLQSVEELERVEQ